MKVLQASAFAVIVQVFACAPSSADTDGGADATACQGTVVGARCLVTLASNQASPSSIVVSAGRVFWNTLNVEVGSPLGTIAMVPTSGGKTQTLFVGETPGYLVSCGATLYWTDPGESDDGSVLSAPLLGGDPATLATKQLGVRGVAPSDGGIFWIDTDDEPTGGPILETNPDGGTPVSVLAQAAGLQLILSDSALVWTDSQRGVLVKVSTSGGEPVTIASGGAAPAGVPGTSLIAIDSGNVYWAWVNPSRGKDGGQLLKVPVGGGSLVTLATGLDNPNGIAADSHSVYWTDDGSVKKISVLGGITTTIASSQAGPIAIALDSESVYWTNTGQGSSGSIVRATPK